MVEFRWDILILNLQKLKWGVLSEIPKMMKKFAHRAFCASETSRTLSGRIFPRNERSVLYARRPRLKESDHATILQILLSWFNLIGHYWILSQISTNYTSDTYGDEIFIINIGCKFIKKNNEAVHNLKILKGNIPFISGCRKLHLSDINGCKPCDSRATSVRQLDTFLIKNRATPCDTVRRDVWRLVVTRYPLRINTSIPVSVVAR